MSQQLTALSADPIFVGDLVAAHIKQTYPAETVLVCSLNGEGYFDRDLLERAFGAAGTKDVCAIATLAVVRFPAGTGAAAVAQALRAAYNPEEDTNSGYSVYVNGAVVLEDVLEDLD